MFLPGQFAITQKMLFTTVRALQKIFDAFWSNLKHLDKPRSFFVWEIGVDVLKGENRASDNVPVKSRPSKKKQQCKWRSLFGCVKNKVKSWAIDRIDDLY